MISETLQKILEIFHLSYIYHSGKQTVSSAQNNDQPLFMILDTELLPSTQIGSKDIMIFKNEIPSLVNIFLPKIFCAVVESTNKKAISLLNDSVTEVVTCGMSNKDTFTVSSVIDDRIVISLQRTIKNVHEKIVEPIEVPINLSSEIDQIALLSAVIALILCGVNFENQIINL